MARNTQRDRILKLLADARGREVPSYELAKIALQYNARVKELRAMGCIIRNRTEHIDGQVHGFFWLEGEPVTTLPSIGGRVVHPAPAPTYSDGLFANDPVWQERQAVARDMRLRAAD